MPSGLPSELDQWRAAQQLINRYGEGVEAEATDRVMRALDEEAKDVWLSVLGKVRALQSGYSPDSGKMN